MIYLCRSGCMYIFPMPECLYQLWGLAEVGHETQFYLRVIGGEKQIVIITCNKSFAYFPSFFCPDGNILKVRVQTAKSASGSFCLIEVGMNFAGISINISR